MLPGATFKIFIGTILKMAFYDLNGVFSVLGALSNRVRRNLSIWLVSNLSVWFDFAGLMEYN